MTENAAGPALADGPMGGRLPCRLGDYELVALIGQGGMGMVYQARQLSLDRYVAVKVLPRGVLADPERVRRFRIEAVTAGSLQHPNIVAVHEVGLCEGHHYLVMDYVPGRTLAQAIADPGFRATDFERSVRWMRTIAEAVQYAHERDILHRDLKPSNVLIDEHDRPHVTDFGLAKHLAGSPVSTPHAELTLSGQVLGSPAFIPPEQASGERGRIGRRSDVYALGAILYQLVTGRPPFVGEALADLLRQVLNEDPLRPRLLNPAVPPDLETICLKCLEKEPDRRYPTAQAFAEELGRFLENRPILARPPGPVGKTGRWCRRNPLLAAATGAALLSLLLGLAGVGWQWRRVESQRSRAEAQTRRAEAEALRAQRHAYAADMNLLQRALEDHDLARARELLNRHRPPAGDEPPATPAGPPPLGSKTPHRSGSSRITDHESRGTNQASGLTHHQSPTTNYASLVTDLRGWEWRYLWARCRSDERFMLHQYTNPVWAVTCSPDGKWLAVAPGKGAVALWDTATRQPVRAVAGAGRYVGYKALAFSPAADLLAWGSQETNGPAAVSLWDLRAQRESARLPHAASLVSLAFTPDGKGLATLAKDGALRVWDLASQQVLTNVETAPIGYSPVQRFVSGPEPAPPPVPSAVGRAEPGQPRARAPANRGPGHTDHCGCVAFSPDGRWLAVGELKPQIRLWDWAARREEEPLALPEAADGVTSIAFSNDGRWLAAAGGFEYGTLHVWELATRTERRLTGHQAWIAGLAFSPVAQTLASISADQTLRLWDVEGQTELCRFQGNTAEVWTVAWTPDGRELVTGAEDGTVRCWDPTATPTPPYSVLPAAIWGFGLTFLPDSRSFLTVSRGEGEVVLWDSATLRPVETLSFLETGYSSAALSKDGRWLALSVTNGPVRIWDYRAQRCVTNLAYPEAALIVAVVISPGGRYLHSGAYPRTPGWQGMNRTWEVSSWHEVDLHGIALKGEGFDPAPDDRTLATGHWDGTAAWWDLATGARVALFDCRYGSGALVRFSPDGHWFATASRNGRITLWDVETRQPTPVGLGYGSVLHTMTFSPDGRRLVTTGTTPRGLVKVWDVATGRDIVTLPGEPGFYPRIGFSPDGNTLFAINLAGLSLFWHAPSWEEIEASDKEPRRP